MTSHHPDESLLQAYAIGNLGEPLALLVATHTALCPLCRNAVLDLESIAGTLLEDLSPTALSEDSLSSVLAQLDGRETAAASEATSPVAEGADTTLPQPLRGYLGRRLSDLPWRQRGVVADVALFPDRKDFTTRLLRIRKGCRVPLHRHEGLELTLVLSGAFSDSQGHYLRGDIAVANSSIVHQPVADDDEDCICLAVTDAPVYLAGPIGRLLNFAFKY